MILTIDMGNSNIVLSFFKNDKLIKSFRLLTDKEQNEKYYENKLIEAFKENNINLNNIKGIVFSSVVPVLTDTLLKSLKIFNKKIISLNDKNTKTNIKIRENITRKIGTDIICNIVAGKKLFKENFIIVDMGTATTFDIAIKDGEYVGSIIIPGIKMLAESFHERIKHLPLVEIKKPEHFIGNTTEESINSGIFYGYLGTIKEIIKQIKNEYKNTKFKICSTGGLSNLFLDKELKFFNKNISNLTDIGLNEIWKINN